MDPLEPELRERLKAAFPGLTDGDIDRFEDLTGELAELTGPQNRRAALAIRARRSAFIEEKMPSAVKVMRAFEIESLKNQTKKVRKTAIRHKQPEAK